MKWILFFLPLLIFAKDFGRMGQVFPIEEESLLEYMQRSLSEKETSQKVLQAKERLLEKAKNPAPVQGIKAATKSRSFLLDLSYRVEKDILDLKGRIIAKAGDKVNPLEKIQLTSGLLFLDGDQEKHLAWAREQKGEFKWILVKGKPFEVESHEKRPIYYDQAGILYFTLPSRKYPRQNRSEGQIPAG